MNINSPAFFINHPHNAHKHYSACHDMHSKCRGIILQIRLYNATGLKDDGGEHTRAHKHLEM